MKTPLFTTALSWMSAAVLALWAAPTAAAPYPDPFKRYIIITNELPIPTYPVVQGNITGQIRAPHPRRAWVPT